MMRNIALRLPNVRSFLIATPLLMGLQSALGFPFYDPFANKTGSGGSSYTVGAALATQNDGAGDIWNLTGSTLGGAEPLIVAGNLNYSSMPVSSGNSVSFAGGLGRGDRLNFNQIITVTNTRAYFSYLLKITDLTAVSTSADSNYFSGFSDGTAGQGTAVLRVAARPVVRKSGAGYVLGMSRNNNSADNVYDTNVFNVNDVVFVVGSYDRIGGVTNVNMWINPTNTTLGSNAPPPPTISVPTVSGAFTGDINTSGGGLVQGFVILCQNATAPSGVIDDVRIGTNWSFVTGGDPAVLTNPTNRSVAPGGTAGFSITARGSGTLGYQWWKDGTTPLNDGGSLSGTHSATLTVSGVSAPDAGAYSCFVTNGSGAFAQSASATLSLLTDPIINGQPQDVTTNFGGNASFQVTAGGTSPFGYQWHKQGFGDLSDGGNVSGARSNILTLTGVSSSDAGSYYVTVSNSIAQVDSGSALLTVLDPYISSQPVSVTTNAGGTAVFHAVAVGSGSLSYQWLKNGNLIFGGGNISGENSDTLTISSISTSDQAGYSLAVFGSGSITSSVANLTVLSAVSVAIPPRPRAVLAGTRAVFSVGAAGSGPISYQWQREGTNIPGATSSAYSLTNVQSSMNGNYNVVISNPFSFATSSVVVLGVSNSLTLAETNLIVVRIGDGAQALTINGNSMFLDQYLPNGAYVNTITIPEDGPTGMTAIGWDNINGVNSGSTTGTVLTRSLDGRYMVLAGYNTNLNYGASLATSSGTNVARGIALIDSYGQYNLAVASTYTGYDTGFWRSGITDGTNNFWGGANITGTYYFGFDAAPVVVQNTMVNMRSMALFNGDIYAVGAATPNGVLKINGMPKASSTATVLFPGTTGSFDLTVSPNGNVIYMTDQRAIASGGGVQRYDFNGSTWSLTYTLNTGFGNLGPRYVTADFSGANPVLYVTSNDQTFDNDRLMTIVDTGAGSAATTLANAGVNQTFRSVRFGPVQNYVVPQPTLSASKSGNSFILSWSGSFTLQSSSNVLGTYGDVSSVSPYTNAIGSEPQKFFRLRQ